jgi:hypothetical protein
MFGSQVLEVAIGLVLLYLLLSLISSSIREGIEARLKSRATDLEDGIREILNDPDGAGLARMLYEHPLVYGLFKGTYDPAKSRRNLPSYIPSRNFAVALLDIVARGPLAGAGGAGHQAPGPAETAALSIDSLRAAIGQLPNPPVRRALLAAIDTAQGDLGRAQANVEAWFDSAMERVSGWYKRRTQAIIFAVGLALTVAVNADTLTVVESLVQDDSLRKAIVAEAETIAHNKEPQTADVKALRAELTDLGFPVGWARILPAWSDTCDLWCVAGAVARQAPYHVPGWLITAFAISLGAPFWFDVLKRIMVIRSTVKPKEKTPEEISRDQSAPAAPAPPTPQPVAPLHAHEWAHGDPKEGVI